MATSAKIEVTLVESLELQLPIRIIGCVRRPPIHGDHEIIETKIIMKRDPRKKETRSPARLELIIKVVIITVQKEHVHHNSRLFVANLKMI